MIEVGGLCGKEEEGGGVGGNVLKVAISIVLAFVIIVRSESMENEHAMSFSMIRISLL